MKISILLGLAFTILEVFVKPAAAQSIEQWNKQFSRSEFSKCAMAPKRSLTHRDLQILMTVGLNEIQDAPYLTFRAVETNTDAIMGDYYAFVSSREGFFTQYYICGIYSKDLIRHIFRGDRLRDNAAALLGGILADFHVSVKALEFLESPIPDDIIHGQALLRLTGASGLTLSGELDVATVVALSRAFKKTPDVPISLMAHNEEFTPFMARKYQKRGLLIVPNGEDLSLFLRSDANRRAYPGLARKALEGYADRLADLAERVGLTPEELL